MNKTIATLLLAVPLSFAAQTAPATTPAPATAAPAPKVEKKVKKVKVHKNKKAPKSAHRVVKSNVKKG